MEFAWTDEQNAYRARIRRILDEQLPPDWATVSNGYDTSSDGTVDFARRFCPYLAGEGLLIPHWPREQGGGGADAWHHWILNEEMWAVGEPRSYQYMGINWAGPAILAFGTPAQIETHIPRITSGTMFYCQGFSEPEAGSDLASLRTRADPVPGGYRVNGSKIWTSAASFAEYCFLLARTGAGGRGGITLFLLPMDAPGVTVRVIPGLQGARSLHEVFLDDVELPASAILGTEGGGWEVVRHILTHERMGNPRYSLTLRGLDRAVALGKARGLWSRDDFQAAVARVKAACEAARLMAYKVIDGRVKGHPPSADTSAGRYASILADRLLCDLVGDFLQDALIAGEDPLLTAAYRRVGSAGIAAGTAEIQLELVANELLGLPRGS